MTYNRAVDLWSLGCLSFEFITNRSLLSDELWVSGSYSVGEAAVTTRKEPVIKSEIALFIESGSLDAYAAARPGRSWTHTMEDDVSPAARDLLSSLLTLEPNQRLGMSSESVADGYDLLRKHLFFAGFDWASLVAHTLPPPAVFTTDHSDDWLSDSCGEGAAAGDPMAGLSDDEDSSSPAGTRSQTIAAQQLNQKKPTGKPRRVSDPISPPAGPTTPPPPKRARRLRTFPGMVDSSSSGISFAHPT